MRKTTLLMGLCVCGLLVTGTSSLRAQAGLTPDDISSVLEDNTLHDTYTRYLSVTAYFFPEEATRMGIDSNNNVLNDRSLPAETQAHHAFTALQKSLQALNYKKLSPNRKVEYHMLMDALNRQIWELNQNRLVQDPLYYAQALDSIYDLLLLPQDNSRKQRADLLGRINQLPLLTKNAKENLKNISPRAARLALEKTYYAYVAFGAVEKRIDTGVSFSNDPRDEVAAAVAVQKGKAAIRELFDFFKELSEHRENMLDDDLRIGLNNYTSKLSSYYQITMPISSLEKQLNNGFAAAQHELFEALQPFELSADEEVTVVDSPNTTPRVRQTSADKGKGPVYTPPTANQFYGIANQLQSPMKADNVLSEFSRQADGLSLLLLRRQLLSSPLKLDIEPLIQYFAYQHLYLTRPAYPSFLLRLPEGNQLTKEELLNRDFNEPTYKLLISQEVIPGRYYQSHIAKNGVRRLCGSPTLANGWTLYALQLVQEQNYLITDEERLFVAWQHYLRAAGALLDYLLHTRKYTYEKALSFLMEENGFTEDDATQLLDAVLQQPGEAVSYVWGYKLWKDAAAPWIKKEKNDPARVTRKLLEVGNVSPKDLPTELKRIYKR